VHKDHRGLAGPLPFHWPGERITVPVSPGYLHDCGFRQTADYTTRR
jgi:hypothetical protein